MRTVGPVLLAVVLVVGTLSGGLVATGATPGPTPESRSAADGHAEASGAALGDSVGHLAATRSVDRSVESVRAASVRTGASAVEKLPTGDAASVRVQTRSDPDVVLTQEFRLTPERSGHVAVTHNYSLADRIVGLRTAIPANGTVTATEGFTEHNGTVYEWDGSTPTPSVTYSLPVNETGTRSHAAANGSLLFTDVGEWALFRRPATDTSWTAFGRDPVTYERATRTAGPGAAGDSIVYLGDVRLHPRTASNQTFRLAVPAAANMSESPDDVLDAMERAAADLDVGDRDPAVFAVAAPTDGVPWAVRGLSAGDADFWVQADERLATTDNVWIHEYVHTRQDYRPTATTRWTVEGFASYYAAHQALRYESVSFEAFADGLATAGTTNATLADPATWASMTAYERGALVAGQLDRRVRLASGGERSIDAVFASMNADDGEVNASDFFGAVAAAGNGSVADRVRTAVATDRPVGMWNETQHAAAFGGLPGRVVRALPRGTDPGDYRVSGPYRNVNLSGGEPYTLVAGETLVVDARARNVGNATGYADVALRVDDRVVDTADAEVPARTTRQVALEHTFATPGRYTLAVGNDTAVVRVRRPAEAAVAGFQVTPGSIEQYQSATVNVTVTNDGAVPAVRDVRIRRGNETVATRTVRVGPTSSRTIEAEVQFPAAGTTSVGVNGVGAVQVAVEAASVPHAPDQMVGNRTRSPSNATGAGPGAIAVVIAVVTATVLVRYVPRD